MTSKEDSPNPPKKSEDIEEMDIEFGEKTLLEISEAGREFRKVLMDEGIEGEDEEENPYKK